MWGQGGEIDLLQVPKLIKDNGGKANADTNREKKRLIKSIKDSITSMVVVQFLCAVLVALNML